MRYLQQHIDTLLSSYKGEMPLANFLKFYFKKQPILGSRDRRMISEMAYCFYRCAKGFDSTNLTRSEIMSASLLLAESNLPHMSKILPEKWQSQYGKGFEENELFLKKEGIEFNEAQLFDNKIVFSEGIKKEEWLHATLQRPKLFIRIVPQYLEEAVALLQQESIPFETIKEHCLSFANGIAIEKIVPKKMYRIQDASSQQTASYFKMKAQETVWDCCSGAGGKSLLVKDVAPDAQLCVSDVRKSILDNLAARFQLYGYQIPERLILSVADATATQAALGNRKLQHIIADVPCSGSGTWARTPEQLYFFGPKTLAVFSERQKKIANNAFQHLAADGYFVYITCSVFAAENEELVHSILTENPNAKLLEQTIINGLKMGADSMFVAVLRKI